MTVPTVTLREVTAGTVRAICDLAPAPSQRHFVAPNAVSIAQAYFEPRAWFRAIYAGEEPVGFVMLDLDTEKPEYFVWRFMIAERHQGRGHGAAAIRLVIEHVRTQPNARELRLSYVPGDGSPEGFYRKLGFEPTGQVDDGEIVMRLAL
jgi:diamine N-acetyltransferase